MIKNVVHPGWVRSKTDGDLHKIPGYALIHLYGLEPSETIIFTSRARCGYTEEAWSALNHYYPRYDGRYERKQS